MSYYDTIEEDIVRAKQILKEGKPDAEAIKEWFPGAAGQEQIGSLIGGSIYGKDIYAAYKLLESFVEEIERLNLELANMTTEALRLSRDGENPALYNIAREACHKFGMPWTDPRTGETFPPPRDGFDERGFCDECQRTRKQGHHPSCANKP